MEKVDQEGDYNPFIEKYNKERGSLNMAEVQSFNPSAYRSIKNIREALEDNALKKLQGALETIEEQVRHDGITVLEENCKSAAPGVANMTRMFQNLLESVDEYLATAKKYFDNLHIEY